MCTSVGVSGSWFPRRETSCYSISRSLQVPGRRLEAPAVGVSGSWFLRRETSSYSTRSLQVPARSLEAVGVSGHNVANTVQLFKNALYPNSMVSRTVFRQIF